MNEVNYTFEDLLLLLFETQCVLACLDCDVHVQVEYLIEYKIFVLIFHEPFGGGFADIANVFPFGNPHGDSHDFLPQEVAPQDQLGPQNSSHSDYFLQIRATKQLCKDYSYPNVCCIRF